MIPESRPRRRLAVPVAVAVATALAAGAVAATQLVFTPADDASSERSGGGARSPFREALDELLGGSGTEQAELLDCVAAGGVEPGSGTAGGGVRELAQQVEELRDLRFQEPVEPTFLSSQRFGSRLRRLILEEYPEETADAESRVLKALGAVPPAADLRDVRAGALGEQVAGFYLPDTGELVVRGTEDQLELIDRITLVHELQHAVADQSLGLPVPQKLRPGKEDGDLAALALVEGDATLTMQRYALRLPFRDQLSLLDPSILAEAQAGLDRLPHYLRREFLFPYEDGLRFVCLLYEADGWDAVNGAYDDPPRSTAEVLFPHRYAAGEQPVDPPDPPAPGPGWEAAPTRSFGAANLLWLFEAPGGRTGRGGEAPRAAVRGWAGGEIHLWTRGPRSAVAVVLAESPGRDGLCAAVAEWYAAAFPGAPDAPTAGGEVLAVDGGRQDAVVACTDDEVRLGIAPDLPTARRLTR